MSCGRYGMYLDERDNIHYGWIEPFQLWLPFEHLDFTWGNLTRSTEVMWKSRVLGPIEEVDGY